MPELNNFTPDWLSPPGDTIADILRERRLSPEEFADRIGRTIDYARGLIRGSTVIDQQTARALSSTLGPSEIFWLDRERQYRIALAKCEANMTRKARDQWLETLPLTEMKQYGWLDPTAGSSGEAVQCLRFFGVPTIEAWNSSIDEILSAASLRTSPKFESERGALAAWLRQGEVEAASIDCDNWDPVKFHTILIKIKKLTREEDPDVFIPELRTLCAECGVAVVVLRAPKTCKASGACRALPGGVRLLLLSGRHLSDDHFWFTFFHEAAHLLLHGNHALYVDSPEDEDDPSNYDEKEANSFAADILIPPDRRAEMRALPIDGRRVMRFARDIGIAPGIVVGQMQHIGILTHRQLNNLKRHFRWEE